MSDLLTAKFQETLDSLTRLDRRRTLTPALGVDFSSNDYLGLARHGRIRSALITTLQNGIDLGSGGSRLLRGNHREHCDLESYAADFFKAESALFMATGYQANLSLFTTLPERGDVIVFDELVHASAKEGIRASLAKRMKFAHNDVQSCEDAIKRARAGGTKQVWIAVESLYSMDGDLAPLAELQALALAYDAWLIVDEAHAVGVYGDGRGLAPVGPNVICLHTCGKALGQSGALITLPELLKDIIINTARSFIFTTAPPPLAAVAVYEALKVVQDEPERRDQLFGLNAHAHQRFNLPGDSQILPLMVGEDGDAMALASALQDQGFDIRAIRPPTVPEGTARLRLSLSLNVTIADVDDLADAYEALI